MSEYDLKSRWLPTLVYAYWSISRDAEADADAEAEAARVPGGGLGASDSVTPLGGGGPAAADGSGGWAATPLLGPTRNELATRHI